MSHDHHDDIFHEGEEAPPPGTRIAAWLRWLLVAIAAAVAVGAFATVFHSCRDDQAQAQQLWHCPMHPSVVQDHPGECPICGMDLVPFERGTTTPSAPVEAGHESHRHDPNDAWFCPMHPLETWPDNTGRCPVCEMKLSERKEGEPPPKWVAQLPEGHEGHRHNPNDAWFCPMHPLETSPDGSGECPVCHMKFERRDPAKAAPPPMRLEAPTGLVPIQLTDERIQLTGMTTAEVTRGPLSPTVRATGALAIDDGATARIEPRVSGWVESVAVTRVGERVTRGQLLATLYSPEIFEAAQEYTNALGWKGGARFAEDARKKLEALGVAQEEIDRIRSTRTPNRALALRAPFAGVVVAKAAVQGLAAQPGMALFQVADLSHVLFYADLYESELARVEEGARATLTLAAFPGERFEGTVELLTPVVDPETRTLRARLSFQNPTGRLAPGLYGEANIEATPVESLRIPREALVDTGREQYVFLAMDGGRFEPRRVKAGLRSGDQVEILAGLEEGDTVVVAGNFLIDSESRLRASIEGRGAVEPSSSHEAH